MYNIYESCRGEKRVRQKESCFTFNYLVFEEKNASFLSFPSSKKVTPISSSDTDVSAQVGHRFFYHHRMTANYSLYCFVFSLFFFYFVDKHFSVFVHCSDWLKIGITRLFNPKGIHSTSKFYGNLVQFPKRLFLSLETISNFIVA